MDEFVVQNGLTVSGSAAVSGSISGSSILVTGLISGSSISISSGITASVSLDTISRGGTVYNPNGITNNSAYVIWRAPFNCTVNKIYAFREGGTATAINALNGTSLLLSANYSIASTGTWLDVGTLQNTAVTAGDALKMIVSASGASPLEIAVQMDITRS